VRTRTATYFALNYCKVYLCCHLYDVCVPSGVAKGEAEGGGTVRPWWHFCLGGTMGYALLCILVQAVLK